MGLPTEKDLEKCNCHRCPTYIQGDCKLFCVGGKSRLKVLEKGCICRTCPVHIEHGLGNRAFCLRGKAK